MKLKLFTNLIDALGKVAGGLKAIVNLPKAVREAMRRTLDETYRLIDTTLNMVIIRLGELLLNVADADFLREAARLENVNKRIQADREFRLCRTLRQALRETVYRMNVFQRLINKGFWGLKLLFAKRGAEYPLSKGLPTTGVVVPALIGQLVA